MGKIRDFWVPEMKSLGVKWVKIFNHDGALDFAEYLLSEGFMPIVRFYQPHPNPERFSVKDLVHLDSYRRIGVHYFEFNNEPDQDTMWKGGRVPANAIDIVAENAIANMDAILERDGMPAVPAISSGCRWDLVGKIVELGRKDIFDGPVWQAIHNYPRNRPLDYPYDIGNQEGGAYTERFYNTIYHEPWDQDAWRGRTLQAVNSMRLTQAVPSATVMDDPTCWLAFDYYNQRIQWHLGRTIPILSTECGYIIGEDMDGRYPATTPDLHMAQTLEACRIMMGTSHRFKAAPDYYFCTAFWLLANTKLGSSSHWWERHAWYSDLWPSGILPIVHALRAEPKAVRRWQGSGPVGARTTLRGTVAHGRPNQTIVLEKQGKAVVQTTLDLQNRFTVSDLLPGAYTLRIPLNGTGQQSYVNGADGDSFSTYPTEDIFEEVLLPPGRDEVVVNFDLALPDNNQGESILQGQVRGGAGVVVILVRASDGEEWVTMSNAEGKFRFIDLPADTYTARVHPKGSRVDDIVLDGRRTRDIELTCEGWGYTVTTLDDADYQDVIYCTVENQPTAMVTAVKGNWRGSPVQVSTLASIGDCACALMGLDVGTYMVEVEDIEFAGTSQPILKARVHVDHINVPLVKFVYNGDSVHDAPSQSVIKGRAVGSFVSEVLHGKQSSLNIGEESTIVVLTDQQANRREKFVDTDGSFTFKGLTAGLYAIEIKGHESLASRADIALDGLNEVSVELILPYVSPLPEEDDNLGHGIIAGIAPDANGKLARLVDSVGNEFKHVVDVDDRFRFEFLKSSTYTLIVEGGYEQAGLEIDGSRHAQPADQALEVIFTPVLPVWQADVAEAGSLPGFSAIRVEVIDMPELPVHLWREGWEGMTLTTGSAPQHGEFALEFSPLEPGHYLVEAEGLGVWIDVELTGLESVWVTFRQQVSPISEHVVRPLNERVATATQDETPSDVENTAQTAPSSAPKPADAPVAVEEPLTPPASHYLLLEENMNIHEAITDLTQLTYVLQYISEHGPTIIHNFNDVPEKIIEQAERIGILETPNDDETIQRLQQLRDMGVRIDFLEWMS
ncbi:MAG: carboxypeptidase-like regulatory domain-containing protein [Chloroflexota bacterium]